MCPDYSFLTEFCPGICFSSLAGFLLEQILDPSCQINLLVIKNLADFISNVIGQPKVNAKAILAITVGTVLITDEAYML